MIPDTFIERLRDGSDIETVISSYIALKRRGRTAVGLCPFHSEKTPSFTVYPDSQSFYCFGCQKGGSVITFVQEIERLDFVEAIKMLAQRAGMELPEDTVDDGSSRRKARVLEINRASARFFHEKLISPEGQAAYNYLADRGLARKTIRSFGLGYAPGSWDGLRTHLSNAGFAEEEMLTAGVLAKGRSGRAYDAFRGRVIFPILDLRGNVVGFGGRALEDGRGPKYINSPDTPVFKKSTGIYALNFAKAAKTDMLLLAEGYMDVISLHQAGFDCAIATLGTALTQEQARLISRYTGRVALAYDSDGAGQSAARKALGLFSGLDISVSVLDLGGAKDPDEYIKKFGPTRFRSLIEGGKSAFEFEIERLQKNHDLDTPEGKTTFLNEFCALMADISGEIAREVYISQIARQLDVSKDRLAATAAALRKKKLGAAARRQAHNLRPFVQDNPETPGKRPNAHPQADLSGLAAQRGLVALLLQNPDYFGEIQSKLTENDFADQDLAAIYQTARTLLEENRSPDLVLCASQLTPKQLGIASGLVASARENKLKYRREQIDELIAAIHRQKEYKGPDELGNSSPQQLLEYIKNTRRATK